MKLIAFFEEPAQNLVENSELTQKMAAVVFDATNIKDEALAVGEAA